MLNLSIHTQPDDETCGPTCLHAIYQYYNDLISLETVAKEVKRVKTGGTIASLLGHHALERGYQVDLYVYNVSLFDPSWFHPKPISKEGLIQKLEEQMRYKRSDRFIEASKAKIDFLRLGGQIHFKNLTFGLLKSFFLEQVPILTGLSATYLYQSARERVINETHLILDDIRGEPCGHFVVLCGYDNKKRHVVVADPHRKNPISEDNYYLVSISRLINSIMLGVLTYDADLLIIQPKRN